MMRNSFSKPFFGFSVILLIVLILNGCGKDTTPTLEEINSQLLTSSVWKVSSVIVDDIEQTSIYSGLTLSFKENSYTSTGGAPVWPASGTWQFANNTTTEIKRNDNVVVSINNISETTLTLELLWSKTTFESGRTKSVNGKHVFIFLK